MENLLKQLEDLREQVLKTWRLLDIDRKKARIAEQKVEISKPDFWNDREKAVAITRELDEMEKDKETSVNAVR